MGARPESHGFSLLELVVAVAILATAAMGILTIRAHAIARVRRDRDLQDADRFAARVLARLRTDPRSASSVAARR